MVLERLLALPKIEAIDGFVLPKVDPDNLSHYLEQLSEFPTLAIMPTIETAVAFDVQELRRIRRLLSASSVRPKVLSIRVGGNDLLQLIGVRRSPKRTIYETGIGPVIAQIVSVFRPEGFNLTAPVFEGLNHPDVLKDEVERDLDHGLFGKTAVHPMQVPIIEGVYAVTPQELEGAGDGALRPPGRLAGGVPNVRHDGRAGDSSCLGKDDRRPCGDVRNLRRGRAGSSPLA
jgi:citrate lyase beta subunit